MGRAIKPLGVRRTSPDAGIEIKTTAGFWKLFESLNSVSQTRAQEFAQSNGVELWPAGPFLVEVAAPPRKPAKKADKVEVPAAEPPAEAPF
jgi:hypothetical protein